MTGPMLIMGGAAAFVVWVYVTGVVLPERRQRQWMSTAEWSCVRCHARVKMGSTEPSLLVSMVQALDDEHHCP